MRFPFIVIHERLAKVTCLAIVAWGIFCLAGPSPTQAAGETPTEYQVKAAFLFNFAKFVDWPPEKFSAQDSPLVIGILGEDPFGTVLDAVVQKKSINNRPLLVRRLSAAEDSKQCHILFISRSEKAHLGPLLDALKSQAVLTVGETERFAQQGGMINFVLVNESVKLEINANAAGTAGLKIRSNLLSLAKIINTEGTR